MDLSVIICTYNRYASLEETLDRLLAVGGVDASKHEILVIDNTPRNLRAEIGTRKGAVRTLPCDQTGLSFARNHGIAHSTGDVIAFLDDDALVSPNWCRAVTSSFARRDAADVIGGKVIPKYTATLPAWYNGSLSGYLSCIDWGESGRFLNPGEWIVGANMFFRRTVFEQHGMFDTSLGRKGSGSLLSNEEIALLEKIGIGNIYYDPKPLVEHVIPPERISLPWFRRRVYWQAISDMVSGSVEFAEQALAKEYGNIIASLEPENRNMKCMSFEPRDSKQFALQLRAIYLSAIMLGKGLSEA